MKRASKGYTGVDILLFPAIIVQGLIFQGKGSTVPGESCHIPTGAPSTSQPHLSSPPRSSIRQETEVPQPSSTHTHVADEAASTSVDDKHRGAATTVTSLDARQGSGNIDKTPYIPYDLPLSRVNTLKSDKGRMQHNELIDLVTKLSDVVLALETDLKQTKKVYGAAYTKLIIKVKKLEKTVKISQAKRKAKIVVPNGEVEMEDPSKQGRKIEEIDQDPDISLIQHDADIQKRYEQDMEFDFDVAKEDSTDEQVSTAAATVSTAGVDISPASPTRRVSTADDITMVETLVYIRRSATKTKDKCKGIMEESELAMTKTKRQQEQKRLGYEATMRLQEEARVEVDEKLTWRLQAKERDKYSEVDQAKMLVDLINRRKKYFAAKRDEEIRNKPMTQAQQRTYMCNYIKHMGSHTLQQLRRLSFDKIKELFDTTMKRVNTFIPMETERTSELAAGSSKRVAGEELDQGNMTPLHPRDQRHPLLRYEGQEYIDVVVHDYEDMLGTIFGRQVNMVHVLDFEGLTDEIRQAVTDKLRMAHTGLRGRFCLLVMYGDKFLRLEGLGWALTPDELEDPLRRLCHRLIAFGISRRGHAPKMAWVAPGSERQQVAAARAAQGDKEIPYEGVQADLAPVQAP
uniref:Xylulose kinase-1 n=1 Tax=Tanacetum cinerariifolium TaxID=118510 RepID=A0A6L2LZH5_TANCI|nr:xylulose kinase-1 [Tanacetum cinerariifolium]